MPPSPLSWRGTEPFTSRIILPFSTIVEKVPRRAGRKRTFMSHTESLEKEIRKYVAEYISREASRKSLITITRCEMSADGKRAVLFVSVLPDQAEPIAMDFLKRHQDLIRKYAQHHSKIRAVPWLRFSYDRGEKNRQLVDELLREDDK